MSEEKQIDISNGVNIVLARMDTHPEEFWGDSEKWRFIYKEYFRDAMTEVQKGQIFEKIKQIRMEEFNNMVFRTLIEKEDEDEDDDDEEDEDEEDNSPFGSAPIKRKNLIKW
jgi:hypothetical protein